jgi:hypothetical protein
MRQSPGAATDRTLWTNLRRRLSGPHQLDLLRRLSNTPSPEAKRGESATSPSEIVAFHLGLRDPPFTGECRRWARGHSRFFFSRGMGLRLTSFSRLASCAPLALSPSTRPPSHVFLSTSCRSGALAIWIYSEHGPGMSRQRAAVVGGGYGGESIGSLVSPARGRPRHHEIMIDRVGARSNGRAPNRRPSYPSRFRQCPRCGNGCLTTRVRRSHPG